MDECGISNSAFAQCGENLSYPIGNMGNMR